MTEYEVRYDVRGAVTYVVEAESPEEAAVKAEAMDWDEGDMDLDVEERTVLDWQSNEEVEVDWDKVDELEEAALAETRALKPATVQAAPG